MQHMGYHEQRNKKANENPRTSQARGGTILYKQDCNI